MVIARRIVVLIGLVAIVLAAFGVGDGAPVRLFELGVALCFAAGLVP